MPITEGFTAISLRIPDDLKQWIEAEAEKDFSSINRFIWVILEKEREATNQEASK